MSADGKVVRYAISCPSSGYLSASFPTRADAERRIELIAKSGTCDYPHHIEEVE